jgi:hypothetical protein
MITVNSIDVNRAAKRVTHDTSTQRARRARSATAVSTPEFAMTPGRCGTASDDLLLVLHLEFRLLGEQLWSPDEKRDEQEHPEALTRDLKCLTQPSDHP